MTVTCLSVEEFLECLDAEQKLHQDTIRVCIGRMPVGQGNDRTAVKFNVVFQASAVVDTSEDTQYLLQVGVQCGIDYADDQPETEGTQAAAKLKERVVEYARKRGWRTLPGIIGE